MDKLGISIPPFILHRYLKLETKSLPNNERLVEIKAVDIDGIPYTLFEGMDVRINTNRQFRLMEEPYNLTMVCTCP